MKLWVWSFFEKKQLSINRPVAHRVIGAYFESWVKLLGPPLFSSQTLREFIGSKIGHAPILDMYIGECMVSNNQHQ